MSLATCRSRIGNGIASPRMSGNPRPSQRANTYSSAAWTSRAELEPACEPLRHLAHRRERLAGPRAGVGDRVLDQRGADLRRRGPPRCGPVERQHLRGVGRVDEEERGSVRDVVVVHLRCLVPVRRAPGGVEERDVVGVRELLCRRSGELAETGPRARRCATRARAAARCRGRSRARGRRPPRQRGSAARRTAAPLRPFRDPPPPRRDPMPIARERTLRGVERDVPCLHAVDMACASV